MKTKVIISVFYILILSTFTSAQQPEKMAFAGPNGIFVNLGNEIPFQNPQTHTFFKYKLEKSPAGTDSWIEITQISSPGDFNAFIKKIYELNRSLIDSIPVSELPLNLIWEKSVQFERLDSLKYLGNPLIVRMALGLTYFDTSVESNKKYRYRVSKITSDGTVSESFVTNDISFPGKLENGTLTLISKETNDSFIRLNWELGAGISPARFKLYRRENFSGAFIQTSPQYIYNNVNGVFRITIVDSAVSAGQVYEYYLMPVDYYQNEGNPSDTVTVAAYSFNKIFPPYDISVTKADTLDGLKLIWKMDNRDKIISLKIFRSTSFDSAFTEIGEVSGLDTSFTDLTAEPMIKYFYYLQLNDQFGEVGYESAKVFGLYKSSVIPQAPYLLSYELLDNGIKLIWFKPDDVSRYHVFRNFSDDVNLYELARVNSKDSIVEFIDTSFIRTENIIYSYAVKSENSSGNMSEFSDTVYVIPQNKISIRPPRDLTGYEMDKKVFLYWENMYAENDWVTGYKVFRKIKGSKEEYSALFDSLLSPKQNNYVDTTLNEGTEYEYSVKAYSVNDKESDFSLPLYVNIPATPVFPPAGLKALNKDDGIFISWDKPEQKNLKEFRIYRYERGTEPELIAAVKADDEAEYLDKSVIKGKLYFYFISSVDQSGKESIPGEETGLRR